MSAADYGQFGARVAGALDVLQPEDPISVGVFLASLPKIAAECGITIYPEPT